MGMGKEGGHVIPKIPPKDGYSWNKKSSRYIHIHIKNLACLESEDKAETRDDST